MLIGEDVLEPKSLLHNMSAPPRSKLVIAPHRRGNVLLTFCLPPLTEDWQKDVLEWCDVDNLQELKCFAEQRLLHFHPPAVMSIISFPANKVDDPLLSVAILSRCVGNLFLHRREMELSRQRLSQSVTISDRRFIQNVLGLGAV